MTSPLYQLETMYGMTQLVCEPTRVTVNTATLLDVILSTNYQSHSVRGVYKIGLSDHYMVYTIYLMTTVTHKRPEKVIRFRNYRNFSIESFRNDILSSECVRDIDWTPAMLQTKWDDFKNVFLTLSDKHAPMQTRKLKNRSNPWMNGDILKMIYECEYLKRKAVSCADNGLWQWYKYFRNKVTYTIRYANNKYYDTKISQSQSNPKQLWNVIGQLTGGQNRVDIPHDLTANDFNNYLSKIGMETVEHLIKENHVPCLGDHSIFWKGSSCVSKFNFKEIQQTPIERQLYAIGQTSNNDVLCFDGKLLYMSCDMLAPIITKFANASIEMHNVLSDWKLSRVTPIYKGKGDKTDKGNYRPISVIGHIAKIIEREVKKQVVVYLQRNELITIDQSAYLKYHNTNTALHKVIDDWLYNMADGLFTEICSFDINKCFDTIDHEIILKKMEYYGFQTHTIEWFKSYLLNRPQFVSCHNELSSKSTLETGLPQGSVLGPILFLVYVNDLNRHIHLGACNLYADDTLVYCAANSIDKLQEGIQECVTEIEEWYTKNRLIINVSKSNIMVVSTRQRETHTNVHDFNVFLGNDRLTQLDCLNYLGVKLDANLLWNVQIDELCRKLVFIIYRLSRLRHTLAPNILMYIYHSIVQPKFDYAFTIWGFTSQQNIHRVQRLQNRAARIITNNFDYVNVRGKSI